ncbi:PREDICTED: F-box protein At2g26160-like [Prunus mume]|uniref:F-box protein At2g26160-like n=1 Tax=Prunus mume TaxID=102107 RepID=A0ABM0NFA5_PRUMU|nr:PREDICTED: F-box protein At2g26160-like [Prunus mume]
MGVKPSLAPNNPALIASQQCLVFHACLTRSRNNKNTSSSQVSDQWASIPLLFLILDKLWETSDHIRVAGVCKQWRVAAKEYNRITQRWRELPLPMLLIPTAFGGKLEMYSFPGGKISDIELSLPCNTISMCHGHGWLATMDVPEPILFAHPKTPTVITLVNPFRKAAVPIHLHHLSFSYQHMYEVVRKYSPEVLFPKVILSEDPTLNPDSYMVAVLHKHEPELAFNKGGRKDWICTGEITRGLLMDVICHKSQVFAVAESGDIFSINISWKRRKATILTLQECPFAGFAYKAYLVESTKGDLLHVRRLDKEEGFMVYKLVFNGRDGSVQHVELRSLGDEVMFLSDNCGISVLASNFPQCQRNSIYYVDHCAKNKIGRFNLEDETITGYDYSLSMPKALWIAHLFTGLC